MLVLHISQDSCSNTSLNLMLSLSSSSGGSQFGLTSQPQAMHWWTWGIEMSGQHPSLEKKVFLLKFYVNCCNILSDFILVILSCPCICHAGHTVLLNILDKAHHFVHFLYITIPFAYMLWLRPLVCYSWLIHSLVGSNFAYRGCIYNYANYLPFLFLVN